MEMVLIKRTDLDEVIRDAAIRGAEIALRRAPKDRPSQYSKADAARELGLSRPTLYKMLKAGDVKQNACGKIPADEIERLISARSFA